MQVNFRHLKGRPRFSDRERRAELDRHLRSLPGISLPDHELKGQPSIHLSHLGEDGLDRLLEVLGWIVEEVQEEEVRSS